MVQHAPGWRPCPHGDPTCPCQDVYDGQRDPCHYEGPDASPCPHCQAGAAVLIGTLAGVAQARAKRRRR